MYTIYANSANCFLEQTMQENNKFHAEYRCFAGCNGAWPRDEIIYKCPQCDSLLYVHHDGEALKSRTGEQWRTLFTQRFMQPQFPNGSGIWGKKEWINPAMRDENIVSLWEGGTNLFAAERLGKMMGLDHLYVKLCGNSHTGSFKDLGMTVLVSQVKQMIASGQPIRAVACASTGDTSAALAAYCAAAGIPAVVLLPADKISVAQLIQPLANGALTLSLETDFDGCMDLVKQLTQRKDIYLANSMNSLRVEGQKSISIEMAQQLNWQVPDWVIVPGVNLGNISAIRAGFQLAFDRGVIEKWPRLVRAQAEHANQLYRSFQNNFSEFQPQQAEKTLASAIQIGNPVSVQKAIKTLKAFDGIIEQASENELADAAARGDLAGLFTCPHTGVALAALQKLRDRGDIKQSETVVVVSTAHGLKFTEFKQKYHQDAIAGVAAKHANLPQPLPATLDAVMAAVENRF